jgi:hypothetical protein
MGEKKMAYIKKPPELVSRSIQIEKPVSDLLDEYARFIGCTPEHVANATLKKTLWRDRDYRRWRAEQRGVADGKPSPAVSVEEKTG